MWYGTQFIPVVTRAQFENKVHQSLESEDNKIRHFRSVFLYIWKGTAVLYASHASSAPPSTDITIMITMGMA
jgi:hypothetical protein